MTGNKRPNDQYQIMANFESRISALEQGFGMVPLGEMSGDGLTSISFSSIPQTFRHLRMYVIGQSNKAASAQAGLRVRVNNSSAALYWIDYSTWSGGTRVEGSLSQTSGFIGNCPGASRLSDNYVTHHIVDFPWYFKVDQIKTFISNSSGTAGGIGGMGSTVSSFWEAVAPITSIMVLDDAGSVLGPRARASLYGIS